MCPRHVPTQSKRLQLISETSVRAIEENECSLWSTGPLKSHPGIGHTQLSCMRPGKGQSVVFLRLCTNSHWTSYLLLQACITIICKFKWKKNIAPSYDWPDLFRAAAMQAWLCACKQNTRCFDYAVKLGLQLWCRFSFLFILMECEEHLKHACLYRRSINHTQRLPRLLHQLIMTSVGARIASRYKSAIK